MLRCCSAASFWICKPTLFNNLIFSQKATEATGAVVVVCFGVAEEVLEQAEANKPIATMAVGAIRLVKLFLNFDIYDFTVT